MFLAKSVASTIALAASFELTRIVEIELGRLLPTISALDDKTGQRYQRAFCLVRLHTQPLGVVELPLDENGIGPARYAEHIWQALGLTINEHLRQDCLQVVSGLDTAGLSGPDIPRCIEEREQFLAHAPFVSVIVPTHNRPEQIPSCLRSLLALHYPQYEIIVVDNAPSTNMTADFIHQTYAAVPKVRYLREDRPGISWARNCGIQAARGEIVAFTDDDVVVDSYWLVELVRAFNSADDVVCITGLGLPLELETATQLWFEEHGAFNNGFARRIFDMREHHPHSPLYPYAVGRLGAGASMAFKTAFLHEVGGFDLALGGDSPAPGGEDLAMFFQVITRGYKLVYAPASLLYHLHRRNYPALRKQIYSCGTGLTAYLTKSLLDHPRFLFDFLSKVPYGLFFTLSGRSPKNRQKSTCYPKELTRLELKGMMYGPLAYLRNRRALHHKKALSTSKGNLVA